MEWLAPRTTIAIGKLTKIYDSHALWKRDYDKGRAQWAGGREEN